MTDHAINNARSWAETISDGIAAMQALERGEETATFDGEEFDDSNTVRERLEEMPLSVRVRDGWRNPGEESDGAEEFEILLSTGGPALRIYGKIDGDHALQWQDWGTPWTDYRDTTDQQDQAIATFVGLFYLGE